VLADRRARAAERFAATPLPSTDEEVWRYSRIHELELDRYTPGTVAADIEHGDLGRATVHRGEDAAAHLGELPDHADALGWLHHALTVDPIVVRVPAGVSVAEPIVVRHTGPADGTVAAPHLVVVLGEASEATVVRTAPGAKRSSSSSWMRL